METTYASEFQQAEAVVKRAIRCPDVAAVAMVLIWLYWSRKPEIAMKRHIWYGIRQALSGRDLPGVQDSKFRDIWDNAANWGGGGMEGLTDPSPGPDRLVEDEEAYRLLVANLNDRQRMLADLLQEGADNTEVANRLGVSSPRVSQMRREVQDRWEMLDAE